MIREFEKKDQDDVLYFIKMSNHFTFPNHGRPFRYEDITNISKSYSGKKDAFLVCKKDKDILGTLALKEDDAKVGFLRRFYVHHTVRSRGYGTALMDAILQKAYEFHFKKLVFRCTDVMVSAIFLLTKKGFKEKVTFFNQNCQVIILEKNL